MNSNVSIPESFAAGVECMAPVDIKAFIRALKMEEFQTIGELSIEDLTKMQNRVKLLSELEAFLLGLRNKQKRQL